MLRSKPVPEKGVMLASLAAIESTHLPLDKMAAFSQTIFSDAFSLMKHSYFD